MNTSQNYWNVVEGQETNLLREEYMKQGIKGNAVDLIVKEASQILAKCGDPTLEANSSTGLAFGYVQSGKTMSFTTLTALARDNAYQIIIILAGVTTNLVAQSSDRIEKDLQLNIRKDRKWVTLVNPGNSNNERDTIRKVLDEYTDERFPVRRRRTVLLTVMKQRNHLDNLNKLLSKLNLKSAPVLVIDDEGDQASMNNKARRNARKHKNGIFTDDQYSTIYTLINELKSNCPHHTLVQYTATPQGPLFIHLMNNLSPDFVELLTPGQAYTGGKTFFRENRELVSIIPESEIGTTEEPLLRAPESLKVAMMYFFLGVAEGIEEYKSGNRSMLIHPSRLTEKHQDYLIWVKLIKSEWEEILDGNDGIIKEKLLEKFRVTWKALSGTYPNIPSFDSLVDSNDLYYAIKNTTVRQVNTKNKNSINWRGEYSHILVGGTKMDRGFTVEGLTVTYMPRGTGVGNSDTIQQRARFFGYKQSYLGLCRIFIGIEVYDAYTNYIEHEENLRMRLLTHNSTGEHLNNWFRQVYLRSPLRLTRTNILYDQIDRSIFSDTFFAVKYPHENTNVYTNNRVVVENFLTKVNMSLGENSQRLIDSDILITDLLDGYVTANLSDTYEYSTLVSKISDLVTSGLYTKSKVYLISDANNPRTRTLTSTGRINQLFQGRNKNNISIRDMRDPSTISIQIHHLNLRVDRNELPVHHSVPVLALSLPTGIIHETVQIT